MKLRVTPEGRKGVWLVDVADLADWLDEWFKTHEYIHSFIANDNSALFVGADWTRGDFDKHLTGDVKWGIITGDDGMVAGHRLVCVDYNDHDRPMRYVFDIGPIGREDLENVD